MSKQTFDKIRSYTLITIGVLFLHLGFYFFYQPLSLVVGGMMGISILLEPMMPLSVGIIYFILNVSALVVGAFVFGKTFFYRTVYATLLAPLLVTLSEVFGIHDTYFIDLIDANHQLLMASLVGGVFIGVGIGIVLRYHATTGGIDVYQKMINVYLKVPFSVAVYLTDGLVIIIGMLMNFQSGLFAILSMFIMTVMINKTAIIGRSAYALFIVSEKEAEIKKYVLDQLERGLTLLNAKGGYTNHDKKLIVTTVSRQELYDLKDYISQIDPEAFTLIISTKEVLGEGFHRNDLT